MSNDPKVYYLNDDGKYVEAAFDNNTKRYINAEKENLAIDDLFYKGAFSKDTPEAMTYIPFRAAFALSGDSPDNMLFTAKEASSLLNQTVSEPMEGFRLDALFEAKKGREK